jgi:RNA polymerase sigma-70 factor (subfamily 1)
VYHQVTTTNVEQYRGYLQALVESQLDDRFRSKVDLSGVIQQTLLEAEHQTQSWLTWTREQQTGWLKRALGNNLIDELRKYQSMGRDVTRELSLQQLQELSSSTVKEVLHAHDTSPSTKAIWNEELQLMTKALSQLPADYRRAIELRHFQGQTLEQTATQLGRTKEATAMVVYRALARLRELMQQPAAAGSNVA